MYFGTCKFTVVNINIRVCHLTTLIMVSKPIYAVKKHLKIRKRQLHRLLNVIIFQYSIAVTNSILNIAVKKTYNAG